MVGADALESAIQELNQDLTCIDRAVNLVSSIDETKPEYRLLRAMAAGGLNLKRNEIKARLESLHQKLLVPEGMSPEDDYIQVADYDVLELLSDSASPRRPADLALVIVRRAGRGCDNLGLVHQIGGAVLDSLKRLEADGLTQLIEGKWRVRED